MWYLLFGVFLILSIFVDSSWAYAIAGVVILMNVVIILGAFKARKRDPLEFWKTLIVNGAIIVFAIILCL